MKDPIGPMKGAFRHLGYPDYFRIELTLAKALGVLALLIPIVPIRVKEFAYFGFAITLTSAAIAHFSVGDPAYFVIDPLLFLGTLAVSYFYFERLHGRALPWPARRSGEERGVLRPQRKAQVQTKAVRQSA